MQDLATIEPQSAPAVPAPAKERRISKRMRKALTELATKGVTQREAAKRAGISEFHLSRELRKPQIQVFIAQKARETIGTGALRASMRVVELMDANSEHVSLDASKHVLAIEGIKPVESGTNINITNNIAPGYVIDMRDPRDARPVIEAEPVHKP